MTKVTSILCDYIQALKKENIELRAFKHADTPTPPVNGDIKKAIHAAANMLGKPSYEITDPDTEAVRWIKLVANALEVKRKRVQELELEVSKLGGGKP